MKPNPNPVIIEIIADGIVDGGPEDETERLPDAGVVTILVFKLCGSPEIMRIRRRKKLFLKKGTKLWRRVELSKVRAADHGDAGLVYVVDSEGANPEKRLEELVKGRDSKRLAFPMAVGVSHPCIEAWVLADANAIQQARGLADLPPLPESIEELPDAPKKFPGDHYKRFLALLVGIETSDLSADEKWDIIKAVKNTETIGMRCPSFARFADEVRNRIQPLFPVPFAAIE